ncbi:hypothetical protein CSUI_009074 [Cystoisospora suis]|uniref:Uncharacterized protein n=1 Tax=Cystoisospora suis TaxID=483139 RepID=A0A2C6K5N5_9APIC|nr:hypothetical protein CSUI_009074 [Cystoisospora suis]
MLQLGTRYINESEAVVSWTYGVQMPVTLNPGLLCFFHPKSERRQTGHVRQTDTVITTSVRAGQPRMCRCHCLACLGFFNKLFRFFQSRYL